MKDWTGTATNEARDIQLLDHLQYLLEAEISNYALDEVEDCYDKDMDIVLRGMKWSRGNKDYWLVISPYGHIKYTEKTVPRNLIVQIHNELIDVVLNGIRSAKRS